MSNVRFVEGDVQTQSAARGEFDAVVGRLVLMYLADPVGALARAAQLLRPGGLLCVHECDMDYDWAQPMTPLWTQVREWCLETLERANVAPRMGLSLHSSFVGAGLPSPKLRLESVVGGGVEARPGHGPSSCVGCCR